MVTVAFCLSVLIVALWPAVWADYNAVEMRSVAAAADVVLECSIDEESEPGSPVADLHAELRLKSINHAVDITRFSYIDRDGIHADYIDLDERTGQLTTSKHSRLDREQLCDTGSQLNRMHHRLLTEQGHCTCSLEFDVIVQPEMLIVRVVVELVDVNDNPPTMLFRDDVISLGDDVIVASIGFFESAEAGAEVVVGSIADADGTSSGNGFDRCEMQSAALGFTAANKFTLVVRRRMDDDLTVDVYVAIREKLDRELDGDYQVFKVTAYDGGRPQRSASALVNITIIDVNDNSPRFASTVYEVQVSEDVAVGSVLLRVRATDADSGRNGQIEYSLVDDWNSSSSSRHHASSPFNVDQLTGEVFVVAELDFETRSKYTLDVEATDGGHDRRSDRVRLYVTVTDVNDNAPSIRVNVGRSQDRHHRVVVDGQRDDAVVHVSEAVEPGSFVAHLSVSDPDSGPNGQFRCFVDVGAGRIRFALRLLHDGEYVLITVIGLDREQCAGYDVTVTCTDRGELRRQVASRVVVVELLDENDNWPTFGVDRLEASVVEDNDAGCAVLDVTATDPDAGLNAVVAYSLEPVDVVSGVVSIDVETGTIRTATRFNRHHRLSTLSFVVVATDGGLPPKSGRLPVTLRVVEGDEQDVDLVDGPTAMFPVGHYVFHVYENQPVDVLVGTVSASVIDEDGRTVTSTVETTAFRFFVVGGDDVDPDTMTATCCHIDPESGRLSTRAVFDRERQSSYRFTLSVVYRRYRWLGDSASLSSTSADVDGKSNDDRCRRPTAAGTRSRSARTTATITVLVNDINDNIPLFVFPSSGNDTLTLTTRPDDRGQLSVRHHHSSLMRVLAVDSDSWQNGVVSYSVVGGNGSRLFQVNSTTGSLSINHDDDDDQLETTSYTLIVEAVDGGRPAMSSRSTLNIVIVEDARSPLLAADGVEHSRQTEEDVDVLRSGCCGTATIFQCCIVMTVMYSLCFCVSWQ